MAAIDASKPVAKALELIKEYLSINDVDCDALLVEAKELLENAMEKLCDAHK